MTTPVGNYNERALIPGIVITVAAFLAGIFFFLNTGDKKISVKIFIIYTFATVALFVLLGLTSLIPIENPLNYFIGTQVGVLVLGIAHTWALAYLNGQDDDGNFWHEVVFTIYVLCLGGFVYLFIRGRYGDPWEYNMFLLSTLIVFVLPFFFNKTYHYLVSIPDEEYEKWYFPVDKNFDEDEDIEDDFAEKKTIVAKFEILGQKAGDDKLLYNEAYAPLRMELGEWFAMYLYEYNERKKGQQIEYLDAYGQPQGWNFYIKPKWYQSPRYLDARLTIGENEVSDKQIIVFERV